VGILRSIVTRSVAATAENFVGLRARRGLAFVMLFALFLQGFVLNTHIHGTPLLHGISQVVTVADGGVTDDGTPADDQNSCPTCHQVAHSGQFVTPASVAFYAPSVAISVIALVVASPFVAAIQGFNWQGRAPPR
jgi:hypothetical protein